MYLILKRSIHTQQRESRSADPHMKEGFLFHVRLRNNYNHSLTSAEVLKRRDVSADTIEKLTKLFEISHSPSSALKTIKYELQVEYGDNHVHASVDRSICLTFNSATKKRNDDSNKHLDNCNEEECSPECYVFDCSNVSEDTVEIECAPASDVNGSGTSGKPAEGATLEEEWMEIFEDLKKKMREDPVSFRPAVASFVSNFKKMQTD
ncbi:hypothetical protein J4Q44_G00301420 [Coregonus suidteri]|uniref:Uncharacterized protein n=1 Tax=Coregonus suidteri TaxID=861788 RepID=A0AAN8QCW0_9TELE